MDAKNTSKVKNRKTLKSHKYDASYMTVQAAALELGVSRTSIYYWEKIGKIILYRHDLLKKVVVLREDVQRLRKLKKALRF